MLFESWLGGSWVVLRKVIRPLTGVISTTATLLTTNRPRVISPLICVIVVVTLLAATCNLSNNYPALALPCPALLPSRALPKADAWENLWGTPAQRAAHAAGLMCLLYGHRGMCLQKDRYGRSISTRALGCVVAFFFGRPGKYAFSIASWVKLSTSAEIFWDLWHWPLALSCEGDCLVLGFGPTPYDHQRLNTRTKNKPKTPKFPKVIITCIVKPLQNLYNTS